MRGFAMLTGLAGTIFAFVFWVIVATTHSIYAHPGPGPTAIAMFALLAVGAIGSVLAALGGRWAPAMIAVAVIPAGAAYFIPGLMMLAAALAATNADRQLTSGTK